MIFLVDEPPQEHILQQLRAWQGEVDVIEDFSARVQRAGELYEKHRRHATFDAVRGALRAMCGDLEWCCYCETSQAVEIDHFRPKSQYPGHVFAWTNFLWSCGRCNKFKLDRFPLIIDGSIVAIGRSGQPPPEGSPALLDPRTEDPLEFLWLDLHTSQLLPAYDLDALSRARAEETIKILRLNDDALAAWRHEARYYFENELHGYLAARARAASALELSGYRARVRRHPHKIVWESMKRRTSGLPKHIGALFEHIPDARSW